MRHFSVSISLLVVLLGLVLQANAGIFLALKALKLGLPFLASAGLLGTLKLAVISKAGLALGTIGTILGATALKKSKDDYDVYVQDGYGGYGGYGGYDNYGYDQGYNSYRRRRDIGDVDYEDEFDVSDAFDLIKKSDPANCSERLVCDLAYKSASNEELEDDEIAILRTVSQQSNRRKISAAHRSLYGAANEGYNGGICSTTYDSCRYNGPQLMSFVRMFSGSILRAPFRTMWNFLRS